MRRGWSALIALLVPVAVHAQVQQSGPITSLHVPAWATDGVIQDGGSAAGSSVFGSGYITELGITNTGLPFCINNALTSSQTGYYQTCIGAQATVTGNTGSFITFNAYGGAAPTSLYFNINGTNYQFPGNGQGNILGPVFSTINEPMVWANTSGTLAKDGLNAPISHTGSFAVIGDTTLTGNETVSGTLGVNGLATLTAGLAVSATSAPAGVIAVSGSGASGLAMPNLTASTAGIIMPKSASDGSCSGFSGTVINYGQANGNPAGGSYTKWDCSVNGGQYSWLDGGVALATLDTGGLSVTFGLAVSATSAPAGVIAVSGTGVSGLAMPNLTASTAGIIMPKSNAGGTCGGTSGTLINYGQANGNPAGGSFTKWDCATGGGQYEWVDGGVTIASLNAGLYQLGSTAPEHLGFGQTTPPALTSCGTSPDDTGATDSAGTVTMGTGSPTGCVITFNVAYVAAPHCTVTWQGTPLVTQSYAVSNAAITLTQTATSSNKVDYICAARSGG